MGECDSPLHIYTHTYSAFCTGESHSPPNISALNIYSTISSNSWANSIRLYIFTHIPIPHPVRANRIRPLIYPPSIYIPPFHPIHGRIRFALTYLHTYLFRILYGRIAFALLIYSPPIYIPPFHPIHGRIRFAPTYLHTYIFRIRTGESHSPPNISALYIFHHFIHSMCKCNLSNIFFNNINDKNENSVAYTPKDLGFSPAKTRSFG